MRNSFLLEIQLKLNDPIKRRGLIDTQSSFGTVLNVDRMAISPRSTSSGELAHQDYREPATSNFIIETIFLGIL
jgi:hypothetical protein